MRSQQEREGGKNLRSHCGEVDEVNRLGIIFVVRITETCTFQLKPVHICTLERRRVMYSVPFLIRLS
jgi:hypothetical protein